MADQQILRGISATLSWQNVDGNGEAAAPAGAVTIGVVNAAGATVVAAGTATSGTGTDPRTYILTAANNTSLDLLTATWTDAGDGSTHVTTIEVVGGYYFSLAEARASDPVLANDTKYPDEALRLARRQVEEEFERICDVAFVPRYRRQTVWPQSSYSVLLDRPMLRRIRAVAQVSSNGTATAWTSTQLGTVVLDGSVLRVRTGLGFLGESIVDYEHGYDSPPAEVKRAALQRLRYVASQPLTGLPDRATSFSVAEGGTYRLDTAGAYKTGMPDVDAVLGRWSRRVPGLA